MNKRIEELARKAGLEIDRPGHYEFDDFDPEKFAELIVAECNKRANQYIDDCVEVSCLPEYVLEEHFGVKQ